MKNLRVLLTVCLCATAFIGDYIVFRSKYADAFVFRAVVDNLVHAAIGGISSVIFFNKDNEITRQASLTNVFLCTAVSSLIDIDHFIVARSFYLKDLKGLHRRGLFHCTTLWLLVTAAMLLYSYVFKKINLNILTWMLIIAFTSHHIRDANHRGLWVPPFGTTKAFNTYFYLTLICILPHVYSYVYVHYKPVTYKHTVVDYKMLV